MSRAESPKMVSACWLIIATVSSPVTTIWATGLARKARSRTVVKPGQVDVAFVERPAGS